MTTVTDLAYATKYLNSKKVPFMVKHDIENNTASLMGVKIQCKAGKCGWIYYANNKRISKGMAFWMMQKGLAEYGEASYQLVAA